MPPVSPLEQQIPRLEPFVLHVLSQDARQGRMPRRSARLALGMALQVAFLVNLSGVGPLLDDLRGRRTDQEFTPLGQEASRLSLAWLRLPPVADRSSTAWRRTRAAAFLHGAGAGSSRGVPPPGPQDAPPDRMLHDDVEEPAVALPGPGRRLLTVKARVDGSQDPIDPLCLLPGRDRQRVGGRRQGLGRVLTAVAAEGCLAVGLEVSRDGRCEGGFARVWPLPAYYRSVRTRTLSGSRSSRPRTEASCAARQSARSWRKAPSVVE